MARRRARSGIAIRTGPVELPASARVAWAYLGTLLAAVVAAAIVVLINQSVAAAACKPASDLGGCKLAWVIWTGLVSFGLCMIPAALLLKLGWRMIAAAWAGLGLLLVVGAIDQWWWWLLLGLLPAVAALASGSFPGGRRVRTVQTVALLLLDLVTVVAAVFWIQNG